MALDFISARLERGKAPIVESVIAAVRAMADSDTGVLYYGWPKYTDYEAVRHRVDLALLTPRTGVVFIRVIAPPTARAVAEAAESLSQVAAGALAQMVKSPILRGRNRQLKVPITPVIFAPGYDGSPLEDIDVHPSELSLIRFLQNQHDAGLTDPEFEESRSILEGAKALVRPTRRIIEDPERQTVAVALSKLEEEIASFDQKQRAVALTNLGSPQRIRGLAGSGKTVILAMKAALAHLDNPDKLILITYYTRSLRDQLTRLITRFHRHFGEGDPDWRRIHVHHGWGRKDLPGVYREACVRSDISPMSFGTASEGAAPKQSPLDFACRNLLASGRVKPFYDLLLIDEGQDFPDGFYQLCFALTKGARDEKQIVWAYDDLQNVFDVKVRKPEELFGIDTDGAPRVSLDRSLPAGAETNDFVLPKCYRNQRSVLVLAHATGFGVYGDIVQMLQDREHWTDVGYEVKSEGMNAGDQIDIFRPKQNNPTSLHIPENFPLIEAKKFESWNEEVEYCADQFLAFVQAGLQPEDLMAIAVDDRLAQQYLSQLAQALASRGIRSNNIIADRYSEPLFTLSDKVTLTTVYRAKGNEAAVVAVMGCDAVPLTSRTGRNRLFTAFTRTKGWLRITGMGKNFGPLKAEISKAESNSPHMKFVMPDLKRIETIQRDLSEKDAKIQRVRSEIERMIEENGLTEEDINFVLQKRPKRGLR
jgi:superfamily I DNA and RNA helicase